MRLTSNLKVVIANLERFQAGLIPRVIAPVLKPERWHARLLDHARITLRGLVNSAPAGNAGRQELLDHVEWVLGTLAVEASPAATDWRMQFQSPTLGSLSLPHPPPDKVGRPTLAEAENRLEWEQLQKTVFDWVQNEKHWDIPRDGTVSPDLEQVAAKAEWILHLIATHPAWLSPLEKAARDSFLSPSSRGDGLYEALRNNQQGVLGATSPLDDATARAWAEAVLAVWRDLLLAELPGALQKELGKFVREVNRSML